MGWFNVLAIFSAVVASCGLFANYWSIKENNKKRELEIMTSTFKEIKDTESKLYADYKNADEETKKEWDSLLFNTIEFFAFLINERYITDKKLYSFFDDAIVSWHEDIYQEHYSENDVNDPKQYKEFKKLYKKIKNESI